MFCRLSYKLNLKMGNIFSQIRGRLNIGLLLDEVLEGIGGPEAETRGYSVQMSPLGGGDEVVRRDLTSSQAQIEVQKLQPSKLLPGYRTSEQTFDSIK